MLQGKKVVLGVCGGIAAYKTADIASRLKKLGCDVFVVMTKAAQQFITKLTMQTIAGCTVYDDMFEDVKDFDVRHISMAKEKDLFVIVPATANIIGKLACGIADDALSTTVVATKSPVLIAPAMNTNMYENPIVQENIQKLSRLGYSFITPQSGRLACGDVGMGKLADVSDIVDKICEMIAYPKDLSQKSVLVTAGPTREYIDPVRFLSNDSSGKMGYALAKAARYRGARVTLVSGPTTLKPIPGVELLRVQSAQEMYDAVTSRALEQDYIIKAAAVSDFRAKNAFNHKVKKTEVEDIQLVQNPDILKALGQMNLPGVLAGFCMETGNLEAEAWRKCVEKNLDLIVANDLTMEGAGFAGDTNIVKLIDRSGHVEQLPLMEKEQLAHIILNRLVEIGTQKKE